MSKRSITKKENYISIVIDSYSPNDSQRTIQVGETRDELVTLTVTENANEEITWMHLNFVKKGGIR